GKIDSGELTWTFDPAGNRVEERIGGRVIHATFGAANELLTRGGIRFGYDDRGNQTEKIFPSGRKHAFAYSAANRLVSFSTGHEKKWRSKLKVVERYVYDIENQRVAVEEVNGKKVTWFHWEGSRPIEEWQEIGKGRGKKEKGVLYFRDLGGQLLDQVRYWHKDGRSEPDPERCEDDPDDEDDDSGPSVGHLYYLRWIYPDHLGSTSLITNAHGNRLARLDFGPWGEKLGGNHSRIRFGYTGHQWERATGNWYSVWRYLDPWAGRWNQRDPATEGPGSNRYVYVDNSPVGSIDPAGLVAWSGFPPFEKFVLRASLQNPRIEYIWPAYDVSVDFTLTWTRPPGYAPDAVKVLQIIRSTSGWWGWANTSKDDNTGKPYSVSDIQLSSGFFLDVGSKTSSSPYYSSSIVDGVTDTPTFHNVHNWHPRRTWTFEGETAVVFKCSDAVKIIGAVQWGFTWTKGTNSVPLSGPSPEIGRGLSEHFVPALKLFLQRRHSDQYPLYENWW
ncbi:MAG: RHS repeat-associated core domain-containing protein, partial [Thermodesulfobacteriota bacterium]